MNTYGLYVNGRDIQRYVNEYESVSCTVELNDNEYLNYGMDYMGEDNVAADDKVEHYLEGFLEGDWQIDTYWDEPEGVEE